MKENHWHPQQSQQNYFLSHSQKLFFLSKLKLNNFANSPAINRKENKNKFPQLFRKQKISTTLLAQLQRSNGQKVKPSKRVGQLERVAVLVSCNGVYWCGKAVIRRAGKAKQKAFPSPQPLLPPRFMSCINTRIVVRLNRQHKWKPPRKTDNLRLDNYLSWWIEERRGRNNKFVPTYESLFFGKGPETSPSRCSHMNN